MTASIPASDLERARAAYELTAIAPHLWPDAEIHLLPDRSPIELNARLARVGELPPSLREKSRTVRWRASDGTMVNSDNAPDRAIGVWVLPLDSPATVEVTAEAWISLESTREDYRSVIPPIHKSIAYRFIPPISSQFLIRGRIHGYNLGEFPDPADPDLPRKFNVDSNWHLLHPERYQVPPFFYRIDAALKPLRLSRHLTLGHFTIDFPWKSLGMPQFVTVDPNLVRKIEDLVEMINKDGKFRVTGLTPIYGYRSPAFNLGTIDETPDTTLKVPFSMHQYGRAIDFIVDEDGDLVLDDLNEDGKHDIFDAVEIMHYVNILDRQYRAEGRWEMVGGAGLYDHHDFTGRVQTPYVHVDTRGFQSEAGTLVRWAEGWPAGVPLDWSKM
jgi:hypothetical protein